MIKALGDPRIGVVVFKNATVSEYGSPEKATMISRKNP